MSKLDFEQVLPAAFDEASQSFSVKAISGLVTVSYDNLVLTYVPSGNGVGQVQTVQYKVGSTVVATLTLVYDSSNNITSVTKS